MKIFRWEAGSFMILPLSFVTFVQMVPVTVITIYNQGVLGKRGQNEHFKPSLPRSTYIANRITSVHVKQTTDHQVNMATCFIVNEISSQQRTSGNNLRLK